jgi:hypothetical protein
MNELLFVFSIAKLQLFKNNELNMDKIVGCAE